MKQMMMIRRLLIVMVMVWSATTYAQRYETERGRVYFGHELVGQADARSFEDLGCGYAKDCNNVYLNGRVLEFVDPATFRLKKHDTWRNHDNRDERSMPQRGYFKTKWNVYYGDKKIDAVANSFRELGGGYAKDAFNVFYYGEKVIGAVASSFEYKGDGYAQDAFDAYYRGRKIE